MTKDKRKGPLRPMPEVNFETKGFHIPGMYHWPGVHVIHILIDKDPNARHTPEYGIVHLN